MANFEVMVNTNIANVLSSFEKMGLTLASSVKKNQEITKSVHSQLGASLQLKQSYEAQLIALDKASDEYKSMSANISAVKTEIKGIENPFEKILTDTIPFGDQLVNSKNKIEGLSNAFNKVEEAGGFTNVLSDYMGNFQKKVGALSGGLQKAFGGGLQGLLTQGATSISAIGGSFAGLLPIIAPIAVAIGVVIAAIFTLQRMWVNNVGGMQTTITRFIATVGQVWNRFIVQFDKSLRALSPVVKIIIDTIMSPLFSLFSLISGVLDGIFAIITPIFEAIGEVTQAFTEAFGVVGEGAETFDVLKILGGILKFIGETLGVIIKFGLAPLITGFKFLASVIGFALSPLKILIDVFSKGFSEIGKVGKMFQDVFNPKPAEDFKKSLNPLIDIFNFLLGIIKQVQQAITGAFNTDLVKGFTDSIVNGLGGVLQGVDSALGGIGSSTLNALQPVADLVGGISNSIGGTLQGLLDFGQSLFGSGQAQPVAQEQMSSVISAQPISTSQFNNNNSTVVNNNNNVSVHSAGAITQDSAYGIGNVISSSLITSKRL